MHTLVNLWVKKKITSLVSVWNHYGSTLNEIRSLTPNSIEYRLMRFYNGQKMRIKKLMAFLHYHFCYCAAGYAKESDKSEERMKEKDGAVRRKP